MNNKLVYISPNNFPSRAAHTIHIINMCQSFQRLNYEVTLIIPLNRHNLFTSVNKIKKHYGVEEGFKILRIPIVPTILGIHIFSWIVLFLLKRIKPEYSYTRSFMIANLLTKNNIRTIFETHGIEFKNFDKENILSRDLLNKVVVISKALLNIYKENNYDTSKFYVAHDGANILKQKIDKSDLTFNDGKIHIGYVGHLYKGRGIELILNMAQNRSEMIFHIVGGNEQDIQYWKEKSKSLNLQNVIFEGFLPPNKVSILRKKYDVLLAPYEEKVRISGNVGDTSKWMSPLKIFEYMSDKKPILVSDLPVLHEVLKNKYNCLFCEVNNLENWLKNLDLLVTDTELANKISENAFKEFYEKYTWDKRAENILNNATLN